MQKKRKGRVISVINVKGGVGKTTTSAYLAFALRDRGYKVLAMDLDASANLTCYLEPRFDFEDPEYTCLDAFTGDVKTRDTIVNVGENLDLMPSGIELAFMFWTSEGESKNFSIDDNTIVRDEINQVREDYDFIVVDTPPTLGPMMQNALCASDDLIIPCSMDKDSVKALGYMKMFIDMVTGREEGSNPRNGANPNLRVAGVLATKCSWNTNNTKIIHEKLKAVADESGYKMFDAAVRSETYVSEARIMSEPLMRYKRNSNAVKDFNKFIDEYLRDLKRYLNGQKMKGEG